MFCGFNHIMYYYINTNREHTEVSNEDDIMKDGAGDDCSEVKHFRENAKRSGYIIYTVSSYSMFQCIYT